MLQELSDESRRMGLKMNIAKTKVMVVDNTPINVNNVLIENVEGSVYLGQRRTLFVQGNIILRKFNMCSLGVKLALFRT